MSKTDVILGVVARDKVGGLEGVVTSKVWMFNGCIQFGISPKVESGKSENPKGQCFDVQQLEVISDSAMPAPVEPTMPFKFGDLVEDSISGARGKVVEIILFLNGCLYVNYETTVRAANSGKFVDHFVPVQRLKLVQVTDVSQPESAKRPGGPSRPAPTQR